MLKRCKFTFIALAVMLVFGCSSEAPSKPAEEIDRPNILLIVADDLGFSDLGFMGSEISTPNLDSLAMRGTTFTQFYVAPTCSPTRSMLMSGTDNHVAGVGSMHEVLEGAVSFPGMEALTQEQRGKPGYEGYLNLRVAAFPALLKQAGYSTLMAGKWHLGTDKPYRPNARGFDHSFALLNGGASHFSEGWTLGVPMHSAEYTENDEPVELAEDFYSTTHYVDKLISYLSDELEKDDDKPFFGYLAFTAPHDPLHLPDSDLDLYKGKYEEGYEVLRARRFEGLKAKGLINLPDTIAPLEFVPPWESLTSEQQLEIARWMELYAGMVTVVDREVGRVFEFLEENGELGNTIILFFSDNGAAAGSHRTYGFTGEEFDSSLENAGRPGSFNSYGPAWAQMGSTPLRLFKSTVAEGGIRTPFIVAGPGIDKKHTDTLTHVMDIAPTLLDIATDEIAWPAGLEPMLGRSVVPILSGEAESVRDENDSLSWELFGSRAIRKGDWKAMMILPPAGTGEWGLYNLKDDPSEQSDLSGAHPEKKNELIAEWEAYADEYGVVTVGR